MYVVNIIIAIVFLLFSVLFATRAYDQYPRYWVYQAKVDGVLNSGTLEIKGTDKFPIHHVVEKLGGHADILYTERITKEDYNRIVK